MIIRGRKEGVTTPNLLFANKNVRSYSSRLEGVERGEVHLPS